MRILDWTFKPSPENHPCVRAENFSNGRIAGCFTRGDGTLGYEINVDITWVAGDMKKGSHVFLALIYSD
jgi:hypothetical protein